MTPDEKFDDPPAPDDAGASDDHSQSTSDGSSTPGDSSAPDDTATPNDSSATTESDADRNQNHLSNVEDGAGCTEIWEHLSEQRADESDGE